MDKPILIGLFLIFLTFLLWIIIVLIPQINYAYFVNSIEIFNVLTLVAIASFPTGALIIVIRIMQWEKFQFHRGTIFALFMVGLGVTFFILGNPNSHNIVYLKILFNHEYVKIAALASILTGILILTIKTAIWGSKYLEKSIS